MGTTTRKGRNAPIQVRVTPALRAKAEAAATAMQQTLSGWIKDLIVAGVEADLATPGVEIRTPPPDPATVDRLKDVLRNDAARRGAPIVPGPDAILVIRCAQHKRERCTPCGWSITTGYPEGRALGGPSIRYV